MSQVLTQTIEGKEYHSIHLKVLPEDLTYSHIAETLPQNPGFPVMLGSFCGQISDEVLILIQLLCKRYDNHYYVDGEAAKSFPCH